MNVLEFEGIRRAYRKGEEVLRGVTFAVERGQVVGLLGKNGAGKTTLIRIAMGMLDSQGGSTRLFGQDPRRDPVEIRRRLGYVAEDQVLPPFLRVGEVIDLHRRLFPGWDQALEEQLRERFGLSRRARIRTLSKGQARQVALLCAVAHRPELLLLDEPAGGLDPAARREFLETSIQLLNEAGSTILFSSHYMADVERLAERVVMLHEGRVLLDNGLDELREGFSVALVPRGSPALRQALAGLDHCLGAREGAQALHAVFRLDPAECEKLLRRELGVSDARCRTVNLEEMFIELAGGQS